MSYFLFLCHNFLQSRHLSWREFWKVPRYGARQWTGFYVRCYESVQTALYIRDFRLSSLYKWDFHSFEMLVSVCWSLITNVSGQPVGPIFKGQIVQEKCQGQLGTQVCTNIHWVRSQKIEDPTVYITVKPVLNGISRDQNIFPLKPGFRLIEVHYI